MPSNEYPWPFDNPEHEWSLQGTSGYPAEVYYRLVIRDGAAEVFYFKKGAQMGESVVKDSRGVHFILKGVAIHARRNQRHLFDALNAVDLVLLRKAMQAAYTPEMMKF
jgi:hypothetical protein